MVQFGIEIVYMTGMGLVADQDIAALKPEQILQFAAAQKDAIPADTQVCFYSCTNVRSTEIHATLSEALDMPVITSNQSVINYINSL